MNDKEIVSIAEKIIADKGQIDFNKHFPSLPPDERDRLISLISGRGKYMLDKVPNTEAWILRKNPAYKNQWSHDVKLALFTATLSLIVGGILWRLDSREKTQQVQQLQEQLKSVSDKLDSLLNH